MLVYLLLTAIPTPAEQAHKIGAMAAASQSRPDFDALAGDLLDELVIALEKLDEERPISPIFVERVVVSPSLSEEAKQRLTYALSAHLRKSTRLREIQCIACDDLMHSRIEGSEWRVGHMTGIERARELGAHSRLVIAFDSVPTPDEHLTLDARIEAPTSPEILWAKRLVSNEDRTLLQRDPDKIETVEAREKELYQLKRFPPMLGHALFLGVLSLPFRVTGGVRGSINGITLGYRLAEVFGPKREILVGLQLRGFVDPAAQNLPLQLPAGMPVMGGIVTLVGAYAITFEDQRIPVFRIGPEVGAYFSGGLGNNFAVGGMIEGKFRFRLGFHFALLYVVESDLAAIHEGVPLFVGGLTWVLGASFNWD